MEYMIKCPHCGEENASGVLTCINCGGDLFSASGQGEYEEGVQQIKTGENPTRVGQVISAVLLSILSLLFGLLGILMLFGIGEGTNNTLAAFGGVSLLFALLAVLFAMLAPHAWQWIAVALFAPLAIFSLLGSWSSGYLLLGAFWVIGLTSAAAWLGSTMGVRIRR